MSNIQDVPRAKALFALYERARHSPASVADAELLEQIKKSYWVTNASDAVSQIFSIVAPACLSRPHLTRQLLKAPIGALVACTCESAESVIQSGTALASSQSVYVTPDDYGKHWLSEVLPTLRPLVEEVLIEVLKECEE